MNRFAVASACTSLIAPAVLGDPTVTLWLLSSRSGAVVAPGSPIDWSITFIASSGDNQGAAMICVDLVQDSANPDLFDLPRATSAAVGMANFNRPSGICNPGEGGAPSGFVGSQRGIAGARNLMQIGGAQNTFGQAFPLGAGVGESANVIAGVGQNGSQAVASGAFSAPSVCGTYSFSLANPIANVIVALNNPPAITLATHAEADLSAGNLSFTVAPIGDVDLDFDVDIADLTQLLAGYGTLGGATLGQGDLTGDGNVDLDDLTLMLGSFGTHCP